MRTLIFVTIAAFCVSCGSSDSDPAQDAVDAAPTADAALSDTEDLAADVPETRGEDLVADDVAEDLAPADAVGADVEFIDVQPEVVEEPIIMLEEELAALVQAQCDDCFILTNDIWDEETEPLVHQQGDFTVVDGGTTIFYRSYARFRMPHPGKVRKIYFYATNPTGGKGAITAQLSTGFPGGHYPCLDEATGEDKFPVYKPFRMEMTAEPGWRVFDVSDAEHNVGGYDEFFVIFDQEGDARVPLYYPQPRFPGDYSSYGGIIADGPDDGMECFPSMYTFPDEDENPLIWLVRVEIEANKVVDKHSFTDMGKEYLSVGGHAAFGDYDNDGDEDMLSNGSLWENNGTGEFTNISEQATLAGLGGETVWGDYDNDGFRDILGVGGKATLFHNEGDGTFTDVTGAAGIFIDANSQGVAWVDFNGDAYLDFYAASYGTLADSEIATRDYVFVNNGDGTFTEVTEEVGIPTYKKFNHGRGVCVADYDEDGDPDIYVGNYRLDPNQLWQNLGPGQGFDDVAVKAGVVGVFEQMAYGHTIGPSWGDLDGDGLFDLVVANLAHPRFYDFSDPTTLYFNNGDATFTAFETPEKGILFDETHSDSVLFDSDNDGDLDLFLTSVYEGRRSYLYGNDGTGMYSDITYDAGITHYNGWGAASADVDNDGDADLVAHRLFRNDSSTGNHYLQVKLTGSATPEETEGLSNRDAIGAVVRAEVGGQLILRQVEGGKGVGCQNSSVLHFGLGMADKVDSLSVTWPSGKTSDLADIPGDQLFELAEPLD